MPGRLAEDWKEKAQPEQQKLRTAMRDVYRSMSAKTFGADTTLVEKAKGPDQYARAVQKTTARELRQVTPARVAVERALRALKEADEEALTETPDWPALGGRGDLKEVEDIADRERDYIKAARAFLKRYERLVHYVVDDVRALRRFGITFARGFGAIPDSPTSPGQVTAPLDATAKNLNKAVKLLGIKKIPRELRKDHKAHLGFVRFVIAEVRKLSSAVKRRDLAGIQRFDRNMTRGAKRYPTRVTVRKLVVGSSYARQIRRLRDTERTLLRAYERL
jgi:hypothetical protein